MSLNALYDLQLRRVKKLEEALERILHEAVDVVHAREIAAQALKKTT